MLPCVIRLCLCWLENTTHGFFFLRAGVPKRCGFEIRRRSAFLWIVVAAAALRGGSAMRLVLQRVVSASVSVDGAEVSTIGRGLLALVGLHEEDGAEDLLYCARKLCGAKLWENESGKSWRQSVRQMEYEILLVSQFTLFGEVTNKKHVPDFKASMKTAEATRTYHEFKALVAREYGGEARIKDGVFGAKMAVSLVNDGPVTLVVDSPRHRAEREAGARGEEPDEREAEAKA